MDENNQNRYDTSNLNITNNSGRRLSNKSVMDDITAENRVRDYAERFKDTFEYKIENLRKYNETLKEVISNEEKRNKLIADVDKIITDYTKKVEKGEVSTTDLLQMSEQELKVIENTQRAIVAAEKERIKLSKANNTTKELRLKMIDEDAARTKSQIENQRKLNQELKEAEKILSEPTTRLDKIANKFSKAGDWFSNIANTLNIDKIANSDNILGNNDRRKIMNSAMSQFGISATEFNTFKNSVISGIQDTNKSIGKSIFGAEDMRTYLSKMDKYGITTMEMAKQQASASITATKYLGVSDETQAEIFRFMKRTNDYTMLDKHNKTIVGLLNAQLGVSKESLDAMSQINTNTANTLYDMGYSTDQVQRFEQDTTAMGAALTNATGNQSAGSIWSNFMNKAFTTTASDAGVMAPVVQQLQQMFDSGMNQQDMLNALSQNPFIQNMMDIMQNGTMQQRTEARQTFTSAGFDSNIITLLTDVSKNQDKISNAYNTASASIENTTDQDVTDYLKGIEVGQGEMFKNWLSLGFDELPWSLFFSLSTAAFAMYLAAGIPKTAKTLLDIGKFVIGGGLKTTLSGFFGPGGTLSKLVSSIGSGVSSTGGILKGLGSAIISPGGIALGTASIMALGVAIAKNVAGNYQSNASDFGSSGAITGESQKVLGLDKDTQLSALQQEIAGYTISKENGQAFWQALGEAASINTAGTLFEGWFTDKAGINKKRAQAFFNYIQFNKSVKSEDLPKYTLAYYLLADKSGALSDISNYKSSDISNMIKASPDKFTKEALQKAADSIMKAWPEYMPVLDKKRQYSDATIDWSKYGIGGAGHQFINNSYYSGYGIGGASSASNSPWPITAGWPNYPESFGGGRHTGMDFGIPQGTPIGSSEAGTVVTSADGWNGGYGNYTIVKGNSGRYYLYAHMSQRKTNVGDKLDKGNLIGLSGTTGNSTGPHLHFEVRKSNRYGDDISPYPYANDGLFNPSGSATITTRVANSEDTAEVKVPTKKFAFTSSYLSGVGRGGPDLKDDRVVNAVNSGFKSLMNQIDALSARQDAQQQMLESFSQAQTRDLTLGDLVY